MQRLGTKPKKPSNAQKSRWASTLISTPETSMARDRDQGGNENFGNRPAFLPVGTSNPIWVSIFVLQYVNRKPSWIGINMESLPYIQKTHRVLN